MVTLFHKPSSPASLRAHALLKQLSAAATEFATEDQASDHSLQTLSKRQEFELEVTEEPPTTDQLTSILEYVGTAGISSIVKNAQSQPDALKRVKEHSDNLLRPIVSRYFLDVACSGADS